MATTLIIGSQWESLNEGKANPLMILLTHDPQLTKYLKPKEIMQYLDVSNYVGIVEDRIKIFLQKVKAYKMA